VSEAREARGAHAPGGPAAARAALTDWVDEAGAAGRVFLEVHLQATGPGRFRVRHHADRDLAPEALAASDDPFAAREIAQTTAAGEHRPLKTAPNLRRGWTLEPLDARGLWTALDYLYPACALHWHAGRLGTLRVSPWEDTAGRQSGIYSSVRLLPGAAVRDAVRACCDDTVCLRRVAWADAGPRPDDLPEPEALVPCPEACSMFIALARKVLILERSPRAEVPGFGPLGAAEAEQVREIVAAAAAGTLGTAREGDFTEPTNRRRIRYLAARLGHTAAAAPEESELPCEGCPRPEPCTGCPLV
jgi:hypothetical protein